MKTEFNLKTIGEKEKDKTLNADGKLNFISFSYLH